MEPSRQTEPSRADRSLGALVAELSRDFADLVRQEFALARTELGEKVRQAGSGVALLAAGGMILLTALFFLVQALVFAVVALLELWLPAEVAIWLAPLAVSIVAGLIGWALLAKGRRRLTAESLAPHRTVHSLRQDAELAKEQI